MSELVGYYKDIFTLLSSCASRQLEEVTFRRSEVGVTELAEGAEKYLRKVMRKRNFTLEWQMDVPPLWVTGDRVLLLFLLENLIDEATRYEVPEPCAWKRKLKTVLCAWISLICDGLTRRRN